MERSASRQQFLTTLDTIDRVVVSAYRAFLGLVGIAIVAGTIWVIVNKPWGAGNQGEWFYFSVAVLVAMGWVLGEFIRVGYRRRSHASLLSSRTSDDGHPLSWELRFGASSTPAGPRASNEHRFEFSRTCGSPAVSLSRDMLPDDDAIEWLQGAVSDGMELNDAIRVVQPAFDEWNSLEQDAYRLYVTRRCPETQSAEPV
jgi:hypothetical protein